MNDITFSCPLNINCGLKRYIILLFLQKQLYLSKYKLKGSYDVFSSVSFSLECYKLIVHR